MFEDSPWNLTKDELAAYLQWRQLRSPALAITVGLQTMCRDLKIDPHEL
jgi:hypothetical protein